MTSDTPLEQGRKAAVNCVEVLAEFQRIALTTDGDEWPDYRSHLARLYSVLRDGWKPICRCWPELVNLAAQHEEGGGDHDQPPMPMVQSWLIAKTLFWTVVANGPYELHATAAWHKWLTDFSPRPEEDPHSPMGNAEVWHRVGAYLTRERTPESLWPTLIATIQQADASVDVTAPPSEPIPESPRSSGPSNPLPEGRSSLQALDQTLEQYIKQHERQLAAMEVRNRQYIEAVQRGRGGADALLRQVQQACAGLQLPPPIVDASGYIGRGELALLLLEFETVRQRLLDAVDVTSSERPALANREVQFQSERLIMAGRSLLLRFRDLRDRVLRKLDGTDPAQDRCEQETEKTSKKSSQQAPDVIRNRNSWIKKTAKEIVRADPQIMLKALVAELGKQNQNRRCWKITLKTVRDGLGMGLKAFKCQVLPEGWEGSAASSHPDSANDTPLSSLTRNSQHLPGWD